MAKSREQPDHADDWDAAFERVGNVSFQLDHRRLWRLLATGIVFLVAGIALSVADSSVYNRVVGGLAALMGAATLVASITQLRQQTPPVVVDSRGITAHYLRGGERLVPWREIQDASVFRTPGTAMVLLLISPEFEARWLASNGAGSISRSLAAAGRRLIGAPSISLPSPLRVDPDELALWIRGRAAEIRGG